MCTIEKTNAMKIAVKNWIDPLNVRNIEETLILLQEWEKSYQKKWSISAKKAYIKWLEYINNLKI